MVVEGLSDLCYRFFYSTAKSEEQREARGYLSGKLGYPDEGSHFEKELGMARHLFRIPLFNAVVTFAGVSYLQRKGYDALMVRLEEEIIGHTAFQVHDDRSLHIFSVELQPKYRGRGLATSMVERVLSEARDRQIQRMRIGGGKHEATNSIHRHFSEREKEFGIVAREGNWVDILYNLVNIVY